MAQYFRLFAFLSRVQCELQNIWARVAVAIHAEHEPLSSVMALADGAAPIWRDALLAAPGAPAPAVDSAPAAAPAAVPAAPLRCPRPAQVPQQLLVRNWLATRTNKMASHA